MPQKDTVDLLAYPFDSAVVLRKKRRIRKELLARTDVTYLEKKIAILGGSTTDQFADFLELFLLQEGIRPTFYQSDYARFWEDAVFGNPELDGFEPDLVIVYTSVRNLGVLRLHDDAYDQEQVLQDDMAHFTQVWDALEEKFHCPIIQNNFERPPYRLLGNQDICDPRGMGNYVLRMNELIYEHARTRTDFLVHDLDGLAAHIGLARWHDADSWYLYKNACAVEVLPEVGYSVSRIIKAMFGRNKKTVVLDLDNTLWDGIVGDDGVEALSMGPETSVGERFREFQLYLRNLSTLGVVLAVDSKNDEENALAGLRHPDSLLPPERFASIVANWEPKSLNIDRIADELSLGADSFVFVDDNPAERLIVQDERPYVTAIPFGDISDAAKLLDRGGYFEVTAFTEDDAKRNQMYLENAQRRQMQKSTTSYEDYLRNLEMVAENLAFDDAYIARIAQLTNKSNQFNLTTLRLSEDDLRGYASDGKHVCIALKLRDRFGDNGLVSVVIAERKGDALDIIEWLMSCRVLKRGLEDVAFNVLLDAAQRDGASKLVGHYYPTKKNGMVKDFFAEMGFELVERDDAGNTSWSLDVAGATPRETQISLS